MLTGQSRGKRRLKCGQDGLDGCIVALRDDSVSLGDRLRNDSSSAEREDGRGDGEDAREQHCE